MAAISQQLPYCNRRQPTVSFYETSTFKGIKNVFFKNETLAVILEGISGSGKTEIALTLALSHENKLKKDENSNYIIVMVSSSSEDLLRNDLQSFHSDLKLNTLEISTARCFKKIYEALNKEPYAATKKLFLFDDINLEKNNTESMLDSTVLACLRFLVNGDGRHKGNWKFIVTTKHRYEEDLTCLQPAANRFKIDGFSEQDSLEFIKGSQPDRNNLKKLHILMGGSPLGLSIAKKQLNGRVQDAEDYIKQVEQCAERYVTGQHQVEGKQGNVIASVAKSLQHLIKESGKDKDSDLLRCILFFDENNITEQLLLSCMDIIDPTSEALVLADDVRTFCSKMRDLFLDTAGENDKRNGLTLHQLVMKALRLLVRHIDQLKTEARQIDCWRALTALCRCLDLDGRFHEKFSMRTSAQAMSIVQFLKDTKQPTINDRVFSKDDTITKIMLIKLLCAISYADMRSRGGIVNSKRRLEEARDIMCKLVCGHDFTELKEIAMQNTETVDIPQKVGERLYSGCKQLMPDDKEAYKEYVGNVSLYQRLTDRDLRVLGLKSEELQNDHIRKTSTLDKLREAGKALSRDKMEKIFAAEFTASIFVLLARLPGYTIEDADSESGLVEDSIQYAQIAKAMYGLIEKEHGVIILNKVTVRRSEELMCRMKLLANKPQLHVEDKILAQKLLEEFKDLSDLEGKAFENGLLRSNLKVDNYHKMLCLEGMMRSHGLLYKAGVQSSYNDGEQLFERCKRYANQEMSKDSCLSNLYQHYADFLHNCMKDEEAIKMLVKAMKLLGEAKRNAASADIPRPEILEVRFIELCDMMSKYEATPHLRLDFTSDEKDYLERLRSDCGQREKTREESIIKTVLDLRTMQQPTD